MEVRGGRQKNKAEMISTITYICKNKRILKDIIDSHTLPRPKNRVPASLDVAASNTNRVSMASHNRYVILMAEEVHVMQLNSS